MTDDEKKRWVRENLPICSRVASEFAEVFGPGVKMNFASENGYTIGRSCDPERAAAKASKAKAAE